MSESGSYSYTFKEVGLFPYTDGIHTAGAGSLNAVITVTDADECAGEGQPTCNPSSSACSNYVGGYDCVNLCDPTQSNPDDQCSDDLQTCTSFNDHVGGAEKHGCACPVGYQGVADCNDINECKLALHNCDQTCSNQRGHFVCVCESNFILEADGHTCTDYNECIGENGGHTCTADNAHCENTPGDYDCVCDTGYEGNGFVSCPNVNECTRDSNDENVCGHPELCEDTDGAYACTCRAGFALLSDNRQCIDIDECAAGNGGCTQTCSNSAGDFECSCADGYNLLGDGATCEDINECDVANGGCDHECINDAGSFTCKCKAGFLLGDGGSCTDNNECDGEGDGNACSEFASCTNAAGGHVCTCFAGYLDEDGDGVTCTEINECEDEGSVSIGESGEEVGVPSLNTCEQICTNTAGGFECSCKKGYALRSAADGWFACDNVDECSDPGLNRCSTDATCTDSVPLDADGVPYSCECDPGYTGSGFECEDVDECAVGVGDSKAAACDSNAVCTNAVGGYACTCADGFGNAAVGDAKAGTACSDFDECAEPANNNCRANAVCSNVAGGFACACTPGYAHDDSTSGETAGEGVEDYSCADVNECLDASLCSPNAACTNADGSYECGACNLGFSGSGETTCTLTTTCDSGPSPCLHGACAPGCNAADDPFGCTVEVASIENNLAAVDYVCDCDGSGYKGQFCEVERNECVEDSPCAQHATCVDTVGSYTCECVDGFFGDGNVFCGDVDECVSGGANCDENAACTNVDGGFLCTCNPGYAGSGQVCELTTWRFEISVANCHENAGCTAVDDGAFGGSVVGTEVEVTVRALDIFGNLNLGETRDVSLQTNTDLLYRPEPTTTKVVDVKFGVGSVSIQSGTAGTVHLTLIDSSKTGVDTSDAFAVAEFWTASFDSAGAPAPTVGRSDVVSSLVLDGIDCTELTTDAVHDFANVVSDYLQPGEIWTSSAAAAAAPGAVVAVELPNERHTAGAELCDLDRLTAALGDWSPCVNYLGLYNAWKDTHGFRNALPTWTADMQCQCFAALPDTFKVAECYLPYMSPEDVAPDQDLTSVDVEIGTLADTYTSCIRDANSNGRKRKDGGEEGAEAVSEPAAAAAVSAAVGSSELHVDWDRPRMTSHIAVEKSDFNGKTLRAELHELPCAFGSGKAYSQLHTTRLVCGGAGLCIGHATSDWAPKPRELELGMSMVVYDDSSDNAIVACIDYDTIADKSSFITITSMMCGSDNMPALGHPRSADDVGEETAVPERNSQTLIKFSFSSAMTNSLSVEKQLASAGDKDRYGLRNTFSSYAVGIGPSSSADAYSAVSVGRVGADAVSTNVYGEDCGTDDWTEWSECSVPCDDGQGGNLQGITTRSKRCPLKSEARACIATERCPTPTTPEPVATAQCSDGNNGGCDTNAICTNSEVDDSIPGIISCACLSYMVGDGYSCTVAEQEAAAVSITYTGSVKEYVSSLAEHWELMQLLRTTAATVAGVEEARISNMKLDNYDGAGSRQRRAEDGNYFTFTFALMHLTASSTTPACEASDALVAAGNSTNVDASGSGTNPFAVQFGGLDLVPSSPATVASRCGSSASTSIAGVSDGVDGGVGGGGVADGGVGGGGVDDVDDGNVAAWDMPVALGSSSMATLVLEADDGWGNEETKWLLTALLVVLIPFMIATICFAAREHTKTKLIELGLNPALAMDATGSGGSMSEQERIDYVDQATAGIANRGPLVQGSHYHPSPSTLGSF